MIKKGLKVKILAGKDKKKEGEVSIDKMPKNNTKKTNKLGDYVDYEEID